MHFVISNLGYIFSFVGILLALILGLFLFWRAGRRELVDSQTLFDVVAVFLAGALPVGRITEFLVRYDSYHFSFRKLVFFNAFPGFDVHGAFLGGAFLVWLYLRNKRDNFWLIADFSASPIAFATFVFLLFKFLEAIFVKSLFVYLYLNYFVGYFIIFWAIKRFEVKKKHYGFFISFFVVASSFLNAMIAVFFFGKYPQELAYYHIVFALITGFLAGVNWYFLSKRKIARDIRIAFGNTLLSVLKLKRIITNINEADNTAKLIVLSPLYLVKWLYFLVKYLGREFVASIFELAHSFGLGK